MWCTGNDLGTGLIFVSRAATEEPDQSIGVDWELEEPILVHQRHHKFEPTPNRFENVQTIL